MQNKPLLEDGKNLKIREKLIKEVSESLNADIFLYSGDINYQSLEKFIEVTKTRSRENVLLFLTTYGGIPDCAYIIAHRMQKYKRFYLYVAGDCKSAGTLIAVGSDEIIMGEIGEFGPLDLQVRGKNDPFFASSLNTIGSIDLTTDKAIEIYIKYIKILEEQGLTNKANLDGIVQFVCTILHSFISQIPPTHLAEVQRRAGICMEYGERLISNDRGNATVEVLRDLITGYSDHSFVINYEESTCLFREIRRENEKERKLAEALHEHIKCPQGQNEQKLAFIEKLTVDKELHEEENATNDQKTIYTRENEGEEREDSSKLMGSVL